MTILINEIFYSIQGETSTSGFPSLFVRLTGCNLKCNYCDTEYAKFEGKEVSIESIIDIAKKNPGFNHITITGGEPLCQENVVTLIKKLCKEKYNIQIETNGSLSIKNLPENVKKIIDVKTPSSGEENSFLYKNLKYLTSKDEFKFVISNIEDYNFSKEFIKKNLLNTKSIINFSPAHNSIEYSKLAQLILEDSLNVRLNLQLHKLIWAGTEEGKIIIDIY